MHSTIPAVDVQTEIISQLSEKFLIATTWWSDKRATVATRADVKREKTRSGYTLDICRTRVPSTRDAHSNTVPYNVLPHSVPYV